MRIIARIPSMRILSCSAFRTTAAFEFDWPAIQPTIDRGLRQTEAAGGTASSMVWATSEAAGGTASSILNALRLTRALRLALEIGSHLPSCSKSYCSGRTISKMIPCHVNDPYWSSSWQSYQRCSLHYLESARVSMPKPSTLM